MPFIIDNFTDSDNVLLTAHTPDSGGAWFNWSANTTSLSPSSAVIIGNELDNNGSNTSSFNCGLYHSAVPPSADYTVTTPIKIYSKTRNTGILSRLQTGVDSAYWMYLDSGAETLALYRRIAGVNTLLQSVAFPLTVGATYSFEFSVTGSGASVNLVVKADGVTKITQSDTNGSRITSAGRVGVWLGGGTDSRIVSLQADEIVATVLSVDAPANLRVYQRISGEASIALSGTYTGTPTNIECRVIPDGGGVAVVDWATIAASPTGGTWSGSVTVPEGGWYNVEVRFSNDTGVTATSSNKFGVGALFSVAGQSNAYRWFVTGSGTADARTSKYNGSWATNTGATAIGFANAMEAALNVPVGMVDTGWDASALTSAGDRGYGYWLNLSGDPYTQWTTRVTAVGEKLEGICWCQGEADAFQSVSGATYDAGLDTLFGRFRTFTSQSTLPVFLSPLPRTSHADADDAGWNTINDVILTRDDGYDRVACDTWDLTLTDTVHYDAAGCLKLGQRFALAVRKYNGELVESRGPRVIGATLVDENTVDITLQHRGGSDISPSVGITGLRFTSNSVTVSSSSVIRQSSNVIRATFSSPLVSPSVVSVAWGMMPSISGVPVDENNLPLSKTISSGFLIESISEENQIVVIPFGNLGIDTQGRVVVLITGF